MKFHKKKKLLINCESYNRTHSLLPLSANLQNIAGHHGKFSRLSTGRLSVNSTCDQNDIAVKLSYRAMYITKLRMNVAQPNADIEACLRMSLQQLEKKKPASSSFLLKKRVGNVFSALFPSSAIPDSRQRGYLAYVVPVPQ